MPPSRIMAEEDPLIGRTLAGTYRVLQRLGSGSFGEIYKVCETAEDQTREFAVKLEKADEKCPQLKREYQVIQEMKQIEGMPRVYGYHRFGEQFYAMVMQLLGDSLEGLFDKCDRRFSVKTVVMIAEQIITRLEALHEIGYIHRDLKPDNIMMGRNQHDSWKVYLIDFGLCKEYRDKKTKVQNDYNERKNMTGTARYTSINNHLGLEQARRDDIEGLTYILIYFLKGVLPWQGLKADAKKERYERIAEKKLSTSVTVLCAGLPIEVQMMLSYSRNLTYKDKPNYSYCRLLFRILARAVGVVYDWKYDWTTIPRARANI